jgi:hypothetical protein
MIFIYIAFLLLSPQKRTLQSCQINYTFSILNEIRHFDTYSVLSNLATNNIRRVP